jgi:hypothetical protein
MDAFRAKIEIFSIVASIHRIHSLNQGQESIFMLRECAQSISRIKLLLYVSFLVKKIFRSQKFFRVPKITKMHFSIIISATDKLCREEKNIVFISFLYFRQIFLLYQLSLLDVIKSSSSFQIALALILNNR